MRYYRIELSKPDGTAYLFKSLGGLVLTSLLPQGPQNPQQGMSNPAALNIEFDLPMANMANPNNNAWLRVWGLGLQDIGSAADLNGLNVAVYGGMAKGLPLANPQQAGLLLKGKVLQALGNWVGTDQTVDMLFVPGGDSAGTNSSPGNFPFTWGAGSQLSQAITQTLGIGMPNYPVQISISPKLTTGYDQTGHYSTLESFSDFVHDLSKSIVTNSNYQGVTISTNGTNIVVSDGSTQSANVNQIAFQDIIGQPTWIAPQQISVKMVMRSDIHIGDTIKLPPALFTTQQAAVAPGVPNKLTFSGNFFVQQVQHFGNFRQADAASWNTTYQCAQILSS